MNEGPTLADTLAPAAGNYSILAKTLDLNSSLLQVSDSVVYSLYEASWHSLHCKADLVTNPAEIDTKLSDAWIEGRDPFVNCSVSPSEYESYDLWYRCDFELTEVFENCFYDFISEGIASIAEIWLNGNLLLTSDNMFLQHRVDVDACLRKSNTLYIRVLALTPLLDLRKPRPAWRTSFTLHKNQAWFRTSLLGRIPTWSPPSPIIGPWLPLSITQQKLLRVEHADFDCSVKNNTGIIQANIALRLKQHLKVDAIELRVGNATVALNCANVKDDSAELYNFNGVLELSDVERWWPHTHGEPKLYQAQLIVNLGTSALSLELAPLGFREFDWQNLAEALNSKGEFRKEFGLSVNGQKVFCRGACWTPIKLASQNENSESLSEPAVCEEEMRNALLDLRDAGVNMLRVSGTFYYEQDLFYRLCDELGILVWQDFMFARLAYPFEDEHFLANVMHECRQVLRRLRSRPSLAILCGNSEIEQQSAMLGIPTEDYKHTFFRETLADLCSEFLPQTAYWPSSPAGGDLPFKITQGVSHYFGVGGYRRDIGDAQITTPQFASECLAFSNVPENQGLKPFLSGQSGFPTHPEYKAGVPRDVSSGWDFADISDHYIEQLFKVDTRALRQQDPQRYFALSRVSCGEIMAKVMGLWRRESSQCSGALIWLLRDLQKGAGWGLIDSQGFPKSVYYYLKRAWSPLCLWFVDDGLNGVSLHLSHDKPISLELELELTRYSANGTVAVQKRIPLKIEPHSQQSWNVEATLGEFFDVNYAYRFGPNKFTFIHAKLTHTNCDMPEAISNEALAEAYYYPIDFGLHADQDPGLTAQIKKRDDGNYLLTIKSEFFARAVAVNAYPYRVSDNYFDLAPGLDRKLVLSGDSINGHPKGSISSFNGYRTLGIPIERSF